MYKNTFVFIVLCLVIFATYFLNRKIETDSKHIVKYIDYFESGMSSLIVEYDTITNVKCATYYYESGSIERNYCELDSMLIGAYNFYFENKNVEQSHFYVDGLKEGISKWYDQTGSLIATVNFNNGKRNGIAHYFNSKGVVKAKNYYQEGYMYYKVINHFDEAEQLKSITKEYFPIIQVNEDSINIGDTIQINFSLPIQEIGLENVDVKINFSFTVDTSHYYDTLTRLGY